MEVRAASFRYGPREVLHEVDVSIESGATCVLVGPNGAGKSTLVRLVCGALSPQSGTVRVDGLDPTRRMKGRSPIAVVPQRNALFPRLTVRENVRILSRLAEGCGGQAECERAVHLASATGFADQRVDTLSGGQMRLANIAAALAGDPALLVLDEPTVGVDSAGRAVMADAIGQLRARGMTILLVTHDLDFAEETATDALVLVGGRVAMLGPLSKLVEDGFGPDAMQVTALFSRDPTGEDRAVLAGHGLQPNGGTRAWSVIGHARETEMLQQALSLALPSLAELRTRRAGLSALLTAISSAEPKRAS